MGAFVIRAKYQNIFLIILMLVFGGQALASEIFSCHIQPSVAQSTEQAMGSDTMDHSQHLAPDSYVDEDPLVDCCSQCDCSVGGCSNSAVLPTTQDLVSFTLLLPTSHYNESGHDKPASSLFRPPASR
jgi:hypothetical protein